MRNFFVMSLLLFFVLFSANHTTFAEANKEFEKGVDIQIDHRWSIKFNQPIDTTSIKPENIYIYDALGNRVFIPVVEFSSDQKTLFISPPLGNYEPNQTYILEINKELQATNGEKLKLTVKKTFVTETEYAVNQRFDKLINDIKANAITFKEAVKQANYNKNFIEKAYTNLTAPLIPENDSEEAKQIRNTVAAYTILRTYTQKSIMPTIVDSIHKARYQEIIEEFINHKIFEGNGSAYDQELSEYLSNVIASRLTNDFVSIGPETDRLIEKIFEPFDELLDQPTNGREIKESSLSTSEFIYEVFGIITFADPNLEKAVRSAVKRYSGDIKPEHVASLNLLFADHRNIKDVDGIQLLTNLKHLYINNNQISNIEPILKLRLNRLDIYNNNLSDEDIKRLKSHVSWIYVW